MNPEEKYTRLSLNIDISMYCKRVVQMLQASGNAKVKTKWGIKKAATSVSRRGNHSLGVKRLVSFPGTDHGFLSDCCRETDRSSHTEKNPVMLELQTHLTSGACHIRR